MTRFTPSSTPNREVHLVDVTSYTEDDVTVVLGYDADGREWTYYKFGKSVALSKSEAIDLIQAIHRNNNRINPDYWADRAPYGSQAYIDDGEEERLAYAERYLGFGEGNELAHIW